MTRRWVAIWMTDEIITQEEMREYGRPLIEEAQRQQQNSAVLVLDGRVITLTRFQFYLPVFIESPDWETTQGFMQAIEERVFEKRLD